MEAAWGISAPEMKGHQLQGGAPKQQLQMEVCNSYKWPKNKWVTEFINPGEEICDRSQEGSLIWGIKQQPSWLNPSNFKCDYSK